MSDSDHTSVMAELLAASQGLDEAADELRRLMPLFEGYRDHENVFHPGAHLRYRSLLDEQTAAIAKRYEDQEKRPPAKDILEARAKAAAKAQDPDLWADYHALDARIAALTVWMGAKSKSITAKQSWLKAQGTLSAGPQPSWSGRS